MHFMYPGNLWLLPLALLGILLPVLAYVRSRQLANSWGTSAHRKTYTLPLHPVRHWIRGTALTVFLVSAVVALCRPSIPNSVVEFDGDTADGVILVDNSRSMYAADSNGQTRMRTAKDVIQSRVLPQMATNRVGLVVYSGKARPVAYLTPSKRALPRVVELAIKPISDDDGSNIAAAFKMAFRYFDVDTDGKADKPGGPKTVTNGKRKKFIVLLSDGGCDENTDFNAIVKGCLERDIQVICFGVGNAAPAQIPVSELSIEDQKLADGPFYKVQEPGENLARAATTSIDERMLNGLASALNQTQSIYIKVDRPTDANLDRLITGIDRQQRTSERELYRYPLALCAVALLVAYAAINGRRRRQRVASGQPAQGAQS